MNKLIFKIVLAGSLLMSVSVSKANPEIVDFVSSVLVEEKLFLVTEGDDSPVETPEIGLYKFDTKDCNPALKNCRTLFVALAYAPKSRCMRTDGQYWFSELPVKLVNNETAIFNVSTITDPNAKNRDYLDFHHNGVCYQLAWGYRGAEFNAVVSLANRIVSGLSTRKYKH